VTDLPESTADDAQPALERLRGGAHSDELALTALYEAHRAELFAFLYRMTPDRETAEDLLQETFMRLIQEARAGRMPDAVRPWLYRVAANAAIWQQAVPHHAVSAAAVDAAGADRMRRLVRGHPE
jgi:RNA polymerase sigma factor (sigma-70 family)